MSYPIDCPIDSIEIRVRVRVKVFYTTFNNISVISFYRDKMEYKRNIS